MSAPTKTPSFHRNNSDHNVYRKSSLVDNLITSLKTKNIMDAKDRDRFLRQVSRFQSSPPINWSKVRPLPASKILKFNDLEAVPDDSELVHLLLDKICVVKLNGGWGHPWGAVGRKVQSR